MPLVRRPPATPRFAAWLSVDNEAIHAAQRVELAQRVYVMPGKPPQIVARGADDFLDGGPLLHPINRTETGEPVKGPLPMDRPCPDQEAWMVWTGTNPEGTAQGEDCNGWSVPTPNGRLGRIDRVNGAWTDACLHECDNDPVALASLYCFERPL